METDNDEKRVTSETFFDWADDQPTGAARAKVRERLMAKARRIRRRAKRTQWDRGHAYGLEAACEYIQASATTPLSVVVMALIECAAEAQGGERVRGKAWGLQEAALQLMGTPAVAAKEVFS